MAPTASYGPLLGVEHVLEVAVPPGPVRVLLSDAGREHHDVPLTPP